MLALQMCLTTSDVHRKLYHAFSMKKINKNLTAITTFKIFEEKMLVENWLTVVKRSYLVLVQLCNVCMEMFK